MIQYKVCEMSPHTHNQNLDKQYVALLKFSFSIFFGTENEQIQQNLHYLEILIGATVSSVSTADGIKSKLI